MNKDEERRLEMLREEWCDFQFILELYGVDLNKEPRFCRTWWPGSASAARLRSFEAEKKSIAAASRPFLQIKKLTRRSGARFGLAWTLTLWTGSSIS